MRFRAADSGDIKFIVEAEGETALLSYGRTLSDAEIERNNRLLMSSLTLKSILVAEVAGQRVGYYWIDKTDVLHPYLIDFYIDNVFRGKGFAKKLVLNLSQNCRDVGAKELRLTISGRNQRSLRFFTKLGAKCIDCTSVERLWIYSIDLDALL